MNRLPWFRFYPADWLKGTRALTPDQKAIWIDLLSYMWEAPKQGELTYTWENISRLTGLDRLTAETEIITMFRMGLFDVFCGRCRALYGHCQNLCNAKCTHDVTLMSRRMSRECNARENDRRKHERRRQLNSLRVFKYRKKSVPASVPPKKSEVRSHIKRENIKRESFTRPTLQEIQDHCRAQKNNVDPAKFWNHYEANGWRVGKNPMKNWKAAVAYWQTSSIPQLSKGGRESVHAADERINAVHDSILASTTGLEDMPELSKAVQ